MYKKVKNYTRCIKMEIYVDRIKAIRKKRSKKVSEIARDLNISVNTYYRWERKEFKPSPNDIRVLAHLLDIDVSYISDLKSFKKYESIYNKRELDELLTSNKNLSPDIKEGLIRIDKILRNLKNENSSLTFQNERYRNIIDNKLIFEYTKDKSLRFSYFNKKFRKIFGKEQNIRGKLNSDLFSEKEAELLTKLERSILQTGTPVENYKITLNGNAYLFFGFQTGSENSDFFNIVVNLVDIDYYCKAADLYKEIYDGIESAEMAVWIKKLEPSVYYEYLSRRMEDISEYSYQTIIQNPNLWREIIYPEDLGNAIPVEPFIREPGMKVYKYRIYTKSKKIKWIKERICYDIKADRFIGFVVDVTDEMTEKE